MYDFCGKKIIGMCKEDIQHEVFCFHENVIKVRDKILSSDSRERRDNKLRNELDEMIEVSYQLMAFLWDCGENLLRDKDIYRWGNDVSDDWQTLAELQFLDGMECQSRSKVK